MKRAGLIFTVGLLMISLSVAAQSGPKKKKNGKKFLYEEVDFEDMIRRYLGKAPGPQDQIEGIYSVSCLITTKSKAFLSKKEKIRVVERKDNYARVAIVKDWPGSKRDYVEVSLSYRDAKRYPVVGALNVLAEGRGLIYKHIEPDASVRSFSMEPEPGDLLEGEYSIMQRRKTVTYKISYLKIYPKVQELANQ